MESPTPARGVRAIRPARVPKLFLFFSPLIREAAARLDDCGSVLAEMALPIHASEISDKSETGREKHVSVCVLLCFIKPILGNRYVRSRGFIMSEPRETQPNHHISSRSKKFCTGGAKQ